MGNASIKRQLVTLIREHAQDVLKQPPEEDLLISIFERAIHLNRLEIQERALENLGIYSPFVLKAAWLDDVKLSLTSSRLLRIEVGRICIRAELRRQETWAEESPRIRIAAEHSKATHLSEYTSKLLGATSGGGTHTAHGLGRFVDAGPFVAAPDVDIYIGGFEFVGLDHAAPSLESFAVALTASRIATEQPLQLGALRNPRSFVWSGSLVVERLQGYCVPLEASSDECELCLRTEQEDGFDHFYYVLIRSSCNSIGKACGEYRQSCTDDLRKERPVKVPDHLVQPVFGPCAKLHVRIQNCKVSGRRQSEDGAALPRLTVSPLASGTVSNDEMLPKTCIAVDSCAGMAMSISRNQLACLAKFAMSLDAWDTFVRGLWPYPSASACDEYQRRFRDWFCKLSKAPSLEDLQNAEDQIMVDFEKRHGIHDIIAQRLLALQHTKWDRGCQISERTSPTQDERSCCALQSDADQMGFLLLQELLHVPEIVVDITFREEVLTPAFAIELCCHESGRDKNSIRIAIGGATENSNAELRCVLRCGGMQRSSLAEASVKLYLSAMSVSLEDVEGKVTQLVEHDGLIYLQMDPYGLEASEPFTQCRSLIWFKSSVNVYLEPEAILTLGDIGVCLFDLCEGIDCVGPTSPFFSDDPDTAAARVEKDPAPRTSGDGVSCWGVQLIAKEPVSILFPDTNNEIIALQFVIGKTSSTCPEIGSNMAGQNPSRCDVFSVRNIQVHAMSSSTMSFLDATSPFARLRSMVDSGDTLLRCDELVCAIGAEMLDIRTTPLHIRLPISGFATATRVACLWHAALNGRSVLSTLCVAIQSATADDLARNMSCRGFLQCDVPHVRVDLFNDHDVAEYPPLAIVRIIGQTFHVHGRNREHVARVEYSLRHVSIANAAGDALLLHCGDGSAKRQARSACYLTAELGSLQHHEGGELVPSLTVDCNVSPLWACAEWQTLHGFNCGLRKYCAEFTSVATGEPASTVMSCSNSNFDCDAAESPSIGESLWKGALGHARNMVDLSGGPENPKDPPYTLVTANVVNDGEAPGGLIPLWLDIRINAPQLTLALPRTISTCGGDRAIEALLIHASFQVSLTSMMLNGCGGNGGGKYPSTDLQVFISGLFASLGRLPATCHFESFSPLRPQASSRTQGGPLLHPTRIYVRGRINEHPKSRLMCASLHCDLPVLRVTVQTLQVPLVLDILNSLQRVRQEFVDIPNLILSSLLSTPDDLTCGIGGTTETSFNALFGTASLGIDVDLVRIGLAHSPCDVELVVGLAEQCSCSFERCISVPCHNGHRRKCEVAALEQPSSITGGPQFSGDDVRSAYVVSKHVFVAEVGAVSVDVIAIDTAKPIPLIEPMNLQACYCAGERSRVDISWLNINLSASSVDALVRLVREFSENAKSIVTSCTSVPQDHFLPVSPCRDDHSSGDCDINQRERSDDAILSPGNDCARLQYSAPQRPPHLKVHNDLGQEIVVALEPGGSTDHMIKNGQWLAIVIPSAEPGCWNVNSDAFWELRLRVMMDLFGFAEAILPLKPAPAIQVALLRKGSEHGRQRVSISDDSTQASLHNCCWLLSRQEFNSTLNELEIRLSSTVFLQNRTPLALAAIQPRANMTKWSNVCLGLPPDCSPTPIPIAWCTSTYKASSSFQIGSTAPMLWCGVAADLRAPGHAAETVDGRRELAKSGALRRIFRRGAWRAILKYHSTVAADYYLPGRDLDLKHHRGESASLCATIYGVSANLAGEQQALFFSVAIEPVVQICNRLCSNLIVTAGHQHLTSMQPGDDLALLSLDKELHLEIEAPSGRLRLKDGIWPTRLRKGHHHHQLQFCDGEDPAFAITLSTELGLNPPVDFWAPLHIEQYSPRAKRLVMYTQYWLANRRNDCQVLVATGRAPNAPSDATLNSVPSNTMRMLSEHLVHRGRTQVALVDRCPDSNTTAVLSSIERIIVDQPTRGEGTTPKSNWNPTQRCFGYSVSLAPMPFYRTLVIEVVRRFSLLNTKSINIWCYERGTRHGPFLLPPHILTPFDPQGDDLRLALGGVVPQLGPAGYIASGAQSDVAKSRSEQRLCEYGYSFSFHLSAENRRRSFQVLHQIDTSACDGGCDCGQLAYPIPLVGPCVAPEGLVWCLTQVDVLVNGSSAVLRFSDPTRPNFRIFNRTHHVLTLRQDCGDAPQFELPPEHKMNFTWYKPEDFQRVCIRSQFHGLEDHRYQIGLVQQHNTLWLRSPRVSSANVSNVLNHEEFLVRTCVRRGSREVHIHPWCLLRNRKTQAVAIRGSAQGTGNLILAPEGGEVCLYPERNSSVLWLQLSSCLADGSCCNYWSQPIQLGRALLGCRGYLRHWRSEAGRNRTAVFEMTMLDVRRDPISDFIIVDLLPCVEPPYLVENRSSMKCLLTSEGGTDVMETCISPGERVPFVPMTWGMLESCACAVKFQSLTLDDESFDESPSRQELSDTILVDIEQPGEATTSMLHIRVLREKPRRVIIEDAEDAHRRQLQRSRTKIVLPALLLMGKHWARDSTQNSKAPHSGSASCSKQSAGVDVISGGVSASTHQPPLFSQGADKLAALRHARSPRRLITRSPRTPYTVYSQSPCSSAISRFRRSSREVFWQKTPSMSSGTRGNTIHPKSELHIAGVGIALLDGAALQEVAYLCIERLDLSMAHLTKHGQLLHNLEFTIASGQLDVRDHTGWVGKAFIQPASGFQQLLNSANNSPIVSLSARFLGLESQSDATHFEVERLELNVCEIEVRLDTGSGLRLAECTLDLYKRAAVAFNIDSELLGLSFPCALHGGDAVDLFLREPEPPELDDFVAPTPVFLRRLFVHRVKLFLSVRFSNKRAGQASDDLLALDHVLRRLVPFDISRARLVLGANPQRGLTARDVSLQDLFLQQGLYELAAELPHAITGMVSRQVPRLLGSQRLFGNPARFCSDLVNAASLMFEAIRKCSPLLVVASLFVGIAAFIESLEGICMIFAKLLCRASIGAVPWRLREERSSFTEALFDAMVYSFPWHLQQVVREWKRLLHISWSSQSWLVTLSCAIWGLWCLIAAASSAMIMTAGKVLQAAYLFSKKLAGILAPQQIIRVGSSKPLRVGPTLFHRATHIQFAQDAAKALNAIHLRVHGTGILDWRLRVLPGREGIFIAVQGAGFYFVRHRRWLQDCENPLQIVWQAPGEWDSVELVQKYLRGSNTGTPVLRFRRFLKQGDNKNASQASLQELQLRCMESAKVAFDLGVQCVTGWTKSDGEAKFSRKSGRRD